MFAWLLRRIKLVDSLEIFSHVANLGDARSLIIHSASTTHRQLTPEQQEAAGAAPNVVRLSIGIEDADAITNTGVGREGPGDSRQGVL